MIVVIILGENESYPLLFETLDCLLTNHVTPPQHCDMLMGIADVTIKEESRVRY